MTKKQILELTGLSESEFYKKYPTKESFEKDAENYKKGGIYIKPENRGKFNATKKATGKSTEELTHSKNPLTRKRAIFAQNAKKWKHAEGGEVKPDNPGFNALPKSVQDKIIANMAHGGKIEKYFNGGVTIANNLTYGTSGPTKEQQLEQEARQQAQQQTNQRNQAIAGSLSQLGNMKMGQSQAGQPPQQGNVGKTIGSVVGGIAGSLIPIPGVGTALGSTVGGMIGGAIDKKSYQNNLEDYNVVNAPSKNSMPNGFKKGGELIKRADGSYSRRGLWDNIRANKGSGKKPTSEMLKQEAKIKTNMAKGGKLEHLGDNLYKVKSYIKGTDKVEVRPNVFFDDKEVVRKNPDGSMQILSDDLGYAKPVEKVAKAMGGKAAQSLFNSMYNKQEMSKVKRPVDKFSDNMMNRKSYAEGGIDETIKKYNELVAANKLQDATNLRRNSSTIPGLENWSKMTATDAKNFAKNYTPIVKKQSPELVKPLGLFGTNAPTNDGTFINNPDYSTIKKYNTTPENTFENNKLYQMNQISPWWLAASEAGNIANMLMSRPDDVNLDRYKPTLVDPYRANKLLASELRKQANAASSAIRGTANTQGTYLASEIANRSRLNEAIGSQLAQSNLQSLLSNTDLINKAKLANVDISTMEKDLRQREKDASRSIRSQALSQMGSNIMQYGRDRKQVDQTNAMLPYIAGENYYFKDENGNPVIMRKYNPFEEGSKFNPYFTQEKAGEKKRFGGKIKKK